VNKEHFSQKAAVIAKHETKPTIMRSESCSD